MAWTMVPKHWRTYDAAKDVFKLLLMYPGEIPQFIRMLLAIFRKGDITQLRQQLRNQIQIRKFESEYSEWVEKFGNLNDVDRAAIKRHISMMDYQPMISLVMPTYNTPEKWLRLAIESVRRQLYPKWELCIADDASSECHVRRVLEEYRTNDSRIKITFREIKGHISATTNTAIEMAMGDFVGFLDHDDELSDYALYFVLTELNSHPEADLIYSDEDKIDEKGCRYDPYFKPDWNPALFLAQNFVCHFSVYRTRLIKQLGGLRQGYDGSQDWDLAMRVIENIPTSRIRHIPHVLYHWRAIPGSAAFGVNEKNYVREAQLKTLRSHFDRIGQRVIITPAAGSYWRIKHPLASRPFVTLIIPTRNCFKILKRCIDSIYQRTNYSPFEILVVDNQSDDPRTLEYLARLQENGLRVLPYDAPFNYAAINNFAVLHARGEIIGLLNNDVEIINCEWLEEMVSYAVQREIGAVGAMLYYRDNSIQHAGVILGLGGAPGVADHPYQHQPAGYAGQAFRALLCQNLSAVTAACLVVRRKVFDEVRGLDEINLAIAFNDVDFCLRLIERGYRNLWTPYAELYHDESASRGYDQTPQTRMRYQKECEYMRIRWGRILENDPAYNPNLALDRESFMLAFPPRIRKPWLLEKIQACV